MTRRMCVDADAMRAESLYVTALGQVCQAEADDATVVLTSAQARLVLARDTLERVPKLGSTR